MADCQSNFHAIIIVLEGNVGVGKSTLLILLMGGIDIVITKHM